MTTFVGIGRLFNGSVAVPRGLVYRSRLAIVLLAVALPLSDVPGARSSISVPGGLSVFPSDLLVLAALLLWIGERLFARESVPMAASPLLRWPLLLFAASLVPGIVRGHERYGESLVGQPVRLVLYATIGLALLKLRPRDVYWGLVIVLYAGVVWQLVLAGYSIATGSHQTSSYLLSTGGSRVLSLGAGMYLAAAFLVALLNVEFDRGRRRWLHLAVAGLSLVAEALTFGRTTYIALVLLIPVVFLTLRETRSFVLRKWFVWVGFAVIAVAAAALSPIGTTLVDRVSANPLNDSTVRWRVGSFEAALSGFKSGQWKRVEPGNGVNRLSDASFEHPPIEDWHMQGGTMASVRVHFPTFDQRALKFQTDGTAFDEGPYSKPVLTHVGQTWKFSAWLRGAQGGELVNVGIWEYGTDGSHIGYANLPVTLTTQMTYHTIQVTVTDPNTTYVRAILRTRSDPQKATIYADRAVLISMPQAAPADPAENVLANPGFEDGTTSWHMQGGELTTIPIADPRFGSLSGQMTTDGKAVDEGLYSEAFPAHKGEDWTFTAWLKGTQGQEVVAVELWEYDAHGQFTHETSSPRELSDTMQPYSVRTRIWKPDTVAIRALVRTWDSAQAVDVTVDRASLAEAGSSSPAQAAAASPGQPTASDASRRWEEPLLGLGFGRSFNYIWNGYAYHLEGDPHNSYIWILAGSGVFALAALLLLFGTFLWDAIRRARAAISFDRALVLWAIGTWFIFMVNALTGPILSDPAFLLTGWIVLLVPALVSAKRQPDRFH